YIKAGETGIGATLMGRNMFGPVRGPWPDLSWRGWWGEEPPYHHPVVVLTHHAREPLEMTGTTFYFCTDGLDAGVALAKELAGGQDVRVGGGASTIRQLLATHQLDSLHLAIAPVLLGDGERVFDDLTDVPTGYAVTKVTAGEGATHVEITKR
ncbi:dihydrofolate reductase family protein, partial [Humibacter sp.]|uniref:dihydrofolate reductase family protein n=1 Tax=Humibacter sp. TaxID=1940291 RepID=UPI002C757E44